MADTSILRNKDFSGAYPYTYTITRKSDGLHYHGVRYGNVRLKLSPLQDFGHKYYSSGIFKSEYKSNPNNFTVKLRWTFVNIESAILWESKVNSKLIHKSTWANIAIGKSSADLNKMKSRRESTFVRKYGVNHNFLIKDVKNKREETILKMYGVKNPGQSPVLREKVKKTCLEKFGVESTFGSEIIREKSKQTMMARLGVSNPLKSKIVQEKIKQNCLKKFGCEYNFQRKDVKEKIVKKREDMYIRLAKMTNEEFLNYLNSISKEKSVQNQKKTQRLKGLKILEETINA